MTDVAALAVRPTASGGRFEIRVTPRARRTVRQAVREGRLWIQCAAPPVEGAANDAVVQLIAETLAVARRHVRLVHGERGRVKTIDVVGLDVETIRNRMTAGLA